MSNYGCPGKPLVVLGASSPTTVLDDYARAMRDANYVDALDRSSQTALKINVSWQHWYPACSTAPWQLEGVIRTLLDDGFANSKMYGAHNRTVVVSAKKGEKANKHLSVLQKYNLSLIHI